MADGYLLSAASIRQLQADHRALRAAITRLERQLPPSTYNPPDFGRETWWGVTVQRDGEDYPDGTGDTYGVQLLSLYFDQTTTGSTTCDDDIADPGRIVVARTVTGCNLPEGSTVIVERRQTKNGVEHWIRPPYATIRRFVAVDSITAGSSGTVTLKVQGLPDEEVEAYYDWADTGGATIAVDAEGFCYWAEEKNQWQILPTGTGSTAPRGRCVIVGFPPYDDGYAWREGDGSQTLYPIIGNDGVDNQNVKIFPEMVGTTSNSSGAVFTVNDTPAAYTDDWITITQDGKYRAIVSFIWTLSPMSESDAEANLQDAGHVHNYTSPTGPAVTGSAQAGATALLRYVTTVGSLIEVDGAAGPQNYGERTSHEEYWYYASSPSSDLVRIWCTVIAYVERSTTDATINLKMSQHSGSSWSRANYRGCFATVEQISDS